MSILKFLGLGRKSGDRGGKAKQVVGDTDTVRKIVRELEEMEPDKARYIAAFAYILGRVANADLDISEAETRKMEDIVRDLGRIPEAQAVLMVQIAKNQTKLFGGTEDYLVTREFKGISTREQRAELLDCLFAVSAADDSITAEEEAQIREIASELGFTHREYVQARAAYSNKRAVLK
jgi:uncharacterized tellurite resistance protein B-like protein